MSWRLARWCVVAVIGCAFPAPAEGQEAEPQGKDIPCDRPAPIGEVSATAGGAVVEEPQCAKAQATAAERPQEARGSGEVVERATDWRPVLHVIILVSGIGLASIGLGSAVYGFSNAHLLRVEADLLAGDLNRVRGLPCTAEKKITLCRHHDDLHASADIMVGFGVGSLVMLGAGAAVAIHQVVKGYPPGAAPQVAFTPAPGGGALVIRGHF